MQRPGGDLFIYFGSGSLRKSVNPSVDHQDKETETSETPQNKENDLLQKEFGKVTQQMTATHSKQQQQNLRNEGIKFPELPQHNAQNIQFSKKSTEHAKKPENMAHSQRGKKKRI